MSINHLLKQASELTLDKYTEYASGISGSCIAALVRSGVEFEKAASLAREAIGEDAIGQLLLSNAETFQKVAELVSGIEKQASDADQAAEQAKFVKLAEAGFSEAEATAMLGLPDSVIEKIASARDAGGSSFDLGSAEGMSANSVDPILAFCMGGDND